MSLMLITKKDYAHKRGGVPIHSEYLKRVFPAMMHITADRMLVKEAPLEKMAQLMGKMAVSSGLIKPEDTVITDGFWAIGVPDKSRIISVCHGTLAGVVGRKHPLAELQAQAMEGTHVVAVSENAARECQNYYGIVPENVIINGVDLNVFCPGPKVHEQVIGIIDPRGKRYKYQVVVDDLRSKSGYAFKFISGNWPDDIRQGFQECSAYLHLSDYEGCSYAVCEAMACGLPVIGSRVGLFAEYEKDFLPRFQMSVGEMVGARPNVSEVLRAINTVFAKYSTYKPREFCKQYSNFDVFSSEWKSYVEEAV